MIRHIVLVALAKDILPKEAGLAFMKLKAVEKLKIQSLSAGHYSSPEGLNRGYNFACVMDFLSLEDRDHYLSHPDHVKIAVEDILPLTQTNSLDSVLAFDYEIF